MIKRAEKSQTSIIKEMWNVCFSQEEESYIDFYFEDCYKPENTIVLSESNIIQSSLQRIPHDMMFNGRVIRISMIVGVATLPRYQKQGNMHKLMDIVIDEIEHQELVTLVQAYEPSLYERYGFTMIYNHNETTIHRNEVPHTSNEGCSYEVTSEAMMRLYATFVKRFNGYYVRDVEYFDRLKLEVAKQKGKIVAYYNNDGKLEAYGKFLPNSKEIIIEECIYLNTIALMKIVNLALQYRAVVKLVTSDSEDLRVLFPNSEVEKKGSTMARINDFDLFKRLYGVDVSTIEEVYASSGKPIFLNEFY